MLPRAKTTLDNVAYRAKATGWMLAALTATAAPVAAAPVFFEVGGSAATSSIQATVDAFRTALGDPNNANAPGPIVGGRREINWDGGGNAVTFTTPPPLDAFLNIRGARFNTGGTGLIQAPPIGGTGDGLAGFFGNPTYGTIFGTFSSPRDFTPVGSNVNDATFFIPGTNGGTAAEVSGFGAVFTDVDLAGSTTLQYFDRNGNLLIPAQSVLPGTVANASLSFAGVVFNAGEEIFRVRITSGNTSLATGVNDGGSIDLVVMDDFLYAEPTAVAAVPEPAGWAILGIAALALMGVRRWRGRPGDESPPAFRYA